MGGSVGLIVGSSNGGSDCDFFMHGFAFGFGFGLIVWFWFDGGGIALGWWLRW